MDTINNYQELGYSIAIQAAKDYLHSNSPNEKRRIIKDLKSEWMKFITNDISVLLAEKLKSVPDEVRINFARMGEE